MDRFSKFHPLISFSFFMGVIAVTILYSNSFSVFASFLCAFLYYARLKGKTAVKTLFKFVIPMAVFAGVFNFLFSHYGESIIFSVKDMRFTAESLLSGLFTGIMIGAVIMWFNCYNEIVTSDKFMALFGGIAPNLTLLFSMVLRFIPLMVKLSSEIKEANEGMGIETKGLKNSVSRFSALISIALEKSIETADSMRARGFGKNKRSRYSAFDFRFSDGISIAFILLMLICVTVISVKAYPQFVFYPHIEIKGFGYTANVIFLIYSLFPLIADFTEDMKWHLLKSKI